MKKSLLLVCLLTLFIIQGRPAFAHCDSRTGPVVKAARQALLSRNVNLALIWVQSNEEAEVKSAFARVMAVRTKGIEVQIMADDYFFETVVRLHRKGEGEPYTGLKDEESADYVLGADKALVMRSIDSLLADLYARYRRGLQLQLSAVLATADYTSDDVKAGRVYTSRYVQFLHYVEGLYASVNGTPADHTQEGSVVPVHTSLNGKNKNNTDHMQPGSVHLTLIGSLVIIGLSLVISFMLQRRTGFKNFRYYVNNSTV